jgi:hypothetical protein
MLARRQQHLPNIQWAAETTRQNVRRIQLTEKLRNIKQCIFPTDRLSQPVFQVASKKQQPKDTGRGSFLHCHRLPQPGDESHHERGGERERQQRVRTQKQLPLVVDLCEKTEADRNAPQRHHRVKITESIESHKPKKQIAPKVTAPIVQKCPTDTSTPKALSANDSKSCAAAPRTNETVLSRARKHAQCKQHTDDAHRRMNATSKTESKTRIRFEPIRRKK